MSDVVNSGLKKIGLNVSKPVLAIICVLFGVILLIWPSLVGIIVGIFLLVQGIILLVEYYNNKKALDAAYTVK
jgi:uncharacterized membrane protein HdeD (DUF308 family)